ncbi:hypothetical protein MES5069_660005 [Mesorhizobium escarrei]|uniref:EamA domain-containing protein n=1 Tax=Mesorhizobium escarrei TaxID=666018 RepID=A0ABN8KD86_9HYPH|nr:hypothetical protein MES5069_660005 [Mesorhizobium escarrei]
MSVGSTSPRPDRHANASPKLWLAWSLLGLLGFIWGTNFLFMKMAVALVAPLEVAWLSSERFRSLPLPSCEDRWRGPTGACPPFRRDGAPRQCRAARRTSAMGALADVCGSDRERPVL